MAVRRADGEGLEDEEIERALQEFPLHRLVSTFRHVLHKIIYPRRPEQPRPFNKIGLPGLDHLG